jgi:dihydropteroate synthase
MMTTYDWHLRDRILTLDRRPLVMGIVNVTPDSFSDGGRYLAADDAVAQGLALVAAGADLLDVGGESTRPGAAPVPLDEELRRVVPVVERLAAQTAVPLSVDTSKAEVARQALAAGAHLINDVTALTGDPAMVEVARTFRAGLILMHMQGTPQTMQLDPRYEDVVRDLHRYFEERLATLAARGIAAEQTVLDPGIGFGKRYEHNLTLLAHLGKFLDLGRPLCLGVSRKGFIAKALGRPGPVEPHPAGTIGVLLHALSRQALGIARVHDVAAVRDALTMFLLLEAKRDPIEERGL